MHQEEAGIRGEVLFPRSIIIHLQFSLEADPLLLIAPTFTSKLSPPASGGQETGF